MAEPLDQIGLDFTQELMDIGVLRKIRNFDATLKEGFVFCVCGDCERFPELYRYQKNKCKEAGFPIKSHLLSLNGGPLLIPQNSPLNTPDGESRVMLKQIAGSLELKGLTTIVAMLHAPCGAAKLANMTIEQVFNCYYRAIMDLKKIHPDTTIQTMCHLHKPDEFSTYLINIERYQEVYVLKAAIA